MKPIKTYTIQSNFKIDVFHLTYADAKEWDDIHQPEIAKISTTKRADQNWNWRLYYFVIKLFQKAHNTVGFVFRVNGIIVGISTFALDYRCTNPQNFNSNVNMRHIDHYAWLISSTPAYDILLKHYNISKHQVMFAKILFDLALNHADNNNKLMWLHSDPNASNGLKNFYIASGFRLCPAQKGQRLRPYPFRRQDYNYLYLSPQHRKI